jgi:predicted ATPase
MITRFYVNNYRCLVAFEIKFDTLNVLCGENGSGKSSVFDALKFVRNLAIGDSLLGGTGEDSERNIRHLEFTKGQDNKIQEFELFFTENGNKFEYTIHIEQVAEHEQPQIIQEHASCDGKELFFRDKSGVRFSEQPGFPLDLRLSALSSIQATPNRKNIEVLRNALADLLILRPDVREMEPESKEEVRKPNMTLGNLTSWYRHLSQDQEWTDALRDSLQNVWPDFVKFRLLNFGVTAKMLELCFDGIEIRFDQLSDGEKNLISLYMIQAALATNAIKTVFIDEPDNYVGLQELKPWLFALREVLGKERQAIIISHNPEILDDSIDFGRYFLRDNHKSPTRAGVPKLPEGLSFSEAIARGWVANG